jgi:hypothetical protein
MNSGRTLREFFRAGSSTPLSAIPVNRLRTWWKPAVLLLLALFAVQAGASLVVRTSRVRGFLTRQLEKSFGRSVEVREFSASLFPAPTLDANGISVGEDPAFGQEYFLRAERLSAGLRWTGLLRGRFELGTLQLDRPSLILVRNIEGRWNLERWLPAASPASPDGLPARANQGVSAPTHHVRKIDISDGRINFKLGDDKTSFAFIRVEGAVEQMAPGRWRLDLEAEPWRSGVPLQLAGTVRARGEVAGTSARLQPAHLQVSWEKSSLADVFRLVGGRDFGVRGTFSGEATAASGGMAQPGAKDVAPGDWAFSVHARAAGIHRWDLTERDDNPRVGLRVRGRWNPGAGTTNADEVIVETRRSNIRGTASLSGIPKTSFEIRLDSAGIQGSDLLDWYRAFQPEVAEGVRAAQYFTGAASFSGWPLRLNEAAFSSPGGQWTVPGLASPLDVHPVRGGTQRGKFVVEPFAVTIPVGRASAQNTKDAAPGPLSAGLISLSLVHDLAENFGGIRVEGQVNRTENALAIAAAFGRNLEHGWDLNGKSAGDLRWEWNSGKPPQWNGRVDLTQARLHVAGLNQTVEVDSLRAEWRNARRKYSLGRLSVFGATWSGSVEQTGMVAAEADEGEVPAWSFHLQADHLDAADLDRWMGPRARPSWLQRLLPSALGGSSRAVPPSVLLKRIRGEGDLRVDEITVEEIKLKQFHAHARLEGQKLKLLNAQAQWSGGAVQGNVAATLSSKPAYQVSASFDHVALAQTPWLAHLSDRLAGTAGGSIDLRAEGIGREALLHSLAGKGEMRLANVELRGWDVAGTMALGEWKAGISRWASGFGTFHVSDDGFELNGLRLASPNEEFLLKGSVSFSQDADLTAESHTTGRNARPEPTMRFMQISGPLTGPKVSLEKATAQQPGD